jgi:integrase
MANPIRKIETLKGTTVWQVDGRRYNASPARPQFPTKEAAEDALARMIAARGAGLSPTRRDVLFAQQAASYLKNNANVLAAKTLRSYAGNLRAHLLPQFGSRRIIDITTAQIKNFLAEKRAPQKVVRVGNLNGPRSRDCFRTIPVSAFDAATMKRLGPETERALSAGTVAQLRGTLAVILQAAVDDGLIAVNPVRAARVGARGRKAKIAATQAVTAERPFTEDQRDSLLRWCAESDSELGDILLLLFKTGVRIGEARGLRWGDIRPDHVLVERSIDDRNAVTPTKTGNVREVELAAALKKALHARFEDRKRTGHGVSATDYIFGNAEPLSVRNLSYRFEVARKACRITNHRMYDTRSTFASILLSRGAPLLWVSKMLGHADAHTTLKSYARWIPGESKGHINLLDDQRALAATERAALNAST